MRLETGGTYHVMKNTGASNARRSRSGARKMLTRVERARSLACPGGHRLPRCRRPGCHQLCGASPVIMAGRYVARCGMRLAKARETVTSCSTLHVYTYEGIALVATLDTASLLTSTQTQQDHSFCIRRGFLRGCVALTFQGKS